MRTSILDPAPKDKQNIMNFLLDNDPKLTKRELAAFTLRLRYLSFREIGINMTCSAERARQLYKKATRKLYHPSRRQLWDPDFDKETAEHDYFKRTGHNPYYTPNFMAKKLEGVD